MIRKDNFTVDTFGRLLDTLLKKKPAVEAHPDDEESPLAKLKPDDEDELELDSPPGKAAEPDAQPQPKAEPKPAPGEAKEG